MSLTRRSLIHRAGRGIATLGAGTLLLREDALATEASGDAGDYDEKQDPPGPQVAKIDAPIREADASLEATEDNILGPFYRPGAPYRAKITPPREPGEVLVVHGRVWGLDTRKPLAGVVIDIWQANASGRYDNDDPAQPPAKGVYRNRARLITDEAGHYEYETILPGQYRIGRDTWRPRHIHYFVRHPGYRELITQLYFRGDPHNDTDAFIKRSLIIELKERGLGDRPYKAGTFDIVLAPE